MALTRVAAVQISAEIGNMRVNLDKCKEQVEQAVSAGAKWVALPEFFTTGIANIPSLAKDAPPADGEPVQFLSNLAKTHNIYLGGSALVRDKDGDVRNAYFLADPDGNIVGRHNKDIPTMWENSIYIGGDDPGILETDNYKVGAAVCWELIRCQTPRRLAGKVDLVMAGSGWWSIPAVPPHFISDWFEKRNCKGAANAPTNLAKYVGAPVIHGSHCGPVKCPMPLGAGYKYKGYLVGGASITSADGTRIAFRPSSEGEGFVIGDVEFGSQPALPVPDKYWLQQRGIIGAFAWYYQNPWGKLRYRLRERN